MKVKKQNFSENDHSDFYILKKKNKDVHNIDTGIDRGGKHTRCRRCTCTTNILEFYL